MNLKILILSGHFILYINHIFQHCSLYFHTLCWSSLRYTKSPINWSSIVSNDKIFILRLATLPTQWRHILTYIYHVDTLTLPKRSFTNDLSRNMNFIFHCKESDSELNPLSRKRSRNAGNSKDNIFLGLVPEIFFCEFIRSNSATTRILSVTVTTLRLYILVLYLLRVLFIEEKCPLVSTYLQRKKIQIINKNQNYRKLCS